MKAFVSYKKRNSRHYVVRLLPNSVIETNTFECTCEQLNSILVAKNQSQLLDAIADFPPLFPMSFYYGKRITPVSETYRVLDLLSDCDAENLQAEFYFDSASSLRAHEGTLEALIKKHGANGDQIADYIAKNCPDEQGYSLVIEPLSDWVTLRNLACISTRLLGLLEKQEPNLLEKAGFARVPVKAIKKAVYAIPVLCDPYALKREVNANTLLEIAGVPATNPIPLYSALVEARKPKTKFLQKDKDFRLDFVDESDDFFFSIQPDILGSGFGQVVAAAKGNLSTALFLCAVESGSQEETAKRLLHALKNRFKDLSYVIDAAIPANRTETRREIKEKLPKISTTKRSKLLFAPKENLIGWYHDEDADLLGLAQPKIDFYSFASALWYTLLFHKGKRITVCGFCGNASLSSERGTRKEYCNDSCRVRAAEQRKNEGDNNDESSTLQGVVSGS